MARTKPCIVCGTNADDKPTKGGDYSHIDCPRCGEFQIVDTAQSILGKSISDDQTVKLSGWIRAYQSNPDMPMITSDVMKKIYSSELPAYSLRLHFLLIELSEDLERIGDQFNVNDEKFIAISFSKDKTETQTLFRHLSEKGLIKYLALGGSAELTPEGYAEIEAIRSRDEYPSVDQNWNLIRGNVKPSAGTAPRFSSHAFKSNDKRSDEYAKVLLNVTTPEAGNFKESRGILTAEEFLKQHDYPVTQALSDLFSIARLYAQYRTADGNQLSSSTLLFAMIDGWQEHIRNISYSDRVVLELLEANVRHAREPKISMMSLELFDHRNFKDEIASSILELQDASRVQLDRIDFSDVVLTEYIESVLSNALRNSNNLFDTDSISVGMFAVSFFVSPSKSLDARLASLSIEHSYIAAKAAQAASYEEPWHQKQWDDFAEKILDLDGNEQDVEISDITLLSQRVGTLSDTINPSDDKLDFASRALTFSKLIADRDLRLPLAIGLFGDWGAGKSFFMELIKKGVSDLSKAASANGSASTEHVRRVAQIDFNAWHYTDANLWASLASRVFDGLMREFTGKRNVPAEIRAELNSKIRSTKEHLQEAEAEREIAIERQEKAERKLEKARICRDKASKKLGQRVLTVIQSDCQKREILTAIKNVAEHFQISATVNSREDIEEIVSELGDATNDFRAVTRQLKNIFSSGSASIISVLVASVVFLIFLNLSNLATLLVEWCPNLHALRGTLSNYISAQSAGLIGIVCSIVGWCGRQVRKASTGLKSANDFLNFFDIVSNQTSHPNPGILVAKKGLETAIETVHKAELHVVDANQRLEESVKELGRVNSGGLVYDFLSERLEESEYTRNLGLISIIREDLGSLHELMKDWQRIASEKKLTSDQSPIDRIILYIDDLDRCHPDQVVEVLQAVHLLLAFDLFVVVVAVDPRWLERSLYKEYLPELPDLIVMTDEQSKKAKRYFNFNPHNYLEKIFQIPFCLPSMGEEMFQDLMTHLSRQRKINVKATMFPAPNVELSRSDDIPMNLQEAKEHHSDELEHNLDQEGEIGDIENWNEMSTLQSKEAAPSDDSQLETLAVIPALLEKESSCLGCMHAFIKTPRLAKRLVNIYRLIRIHAIQKEGSLVWLADKSVKAHIGLIFMLAMHIGYPNISSQLFLDLRKRTPAEKSYIDSDGEWPFSEILNEFIWLSTHILDDIGNKSLNHIPSFRSYSDVDELQNFVLDLQSVRTLLKRNGQSLDGIPIRVLRDWVDEVERFSFGRNAKNSKLL